MCTTNKKKIQVIRQRKIETKEGTSNVQYVDTPFGPKGIFMRFSTF